MKTAKNIESILKKNKRDLFNKFPLIEIGLFGSFIKGENNDDSDLDILIEYDRNKIFSLIDFIKLQTYLSNLLKINVDLALKSQLKTGIGHYILKEVRYI